MITQTARRYTAIDWMRDADDEHYWFEYETRAEEAIRLSRKQQEDAAWEEHQWKLELAEREPCDDYYDSYEYPCYCGFKHCSYCRPRLVGTPDWCWRLKPVLDRLAATYDAHLWDQGAESVRDFLNSQTANVANTYRDTDTYQAR